MADSSNAVGIGGFPYTEDQLIDVESVYDPFSKPKQYDREPTPYQHIIRPFSASAGEHGQPYDFRIPADPYLWTNLQNIRIGGQMRIVDASLSDGDTYKPCMIEESENFEDISLCNNFYQSLWAKVVVEIENCEISDPTNEPYPYKAYFETLLNYSTEYKEKVLKTSGWIEDPPQKAKALSCNSQNGEHFNPALVERRKGVLGSWDEFDIMLHSDIVTAHKHLPPGYRLAFKLTRMKDDFIIMKPTAGTCEVEVEYDGQKEEKDVYIYDTENNGNIKYNNTGPVRKIQKIQIAPKKRGWIQKSIKANDKKYKIELRDVHLIVERLHAPDKYVQRFKAKRDTFGASIPFTRNLLQTYPILEGQTDLCRFSLIVSDQLPETALVAITTQKAYNGSTNTNPFNFEALPINRCSLVVNSGLEPQEPYNILSTDFKRKRTFHSFLENIGASQRDSVCCSIDFEKYYGGSQIFSFDRTNKNRDKYYKMDGGTLGLNIHLSSPATENLQVIFYATYSSEISLRNNRVITKTF